MNDCSANRSGGAHLTLAQKPRSRDQQDAESRGSTDENGPVVGGGVGHPNGPGSRNWRFCTSWSSCWPLLHRNLPRHRSIPRHLSNVVGMFLPVHKDQHSLLPMKFDGFRFPTTIKLLLATLLPQKESTWLPHPHSGLYPMHSLAHLSAPDPPLCTTLFCGGKQCHMITTKLHPPPWPPGESHHWTFQLHQTAPCGASFPP